MEQHPVPQNVTTFQFRLIGDMTLKQFGYLAGGIILAYISYKLPLPFFFTWPLAALFALLGIGFAFVPVEERPMDVWVLSFIKSVYSPTQFVWQRKPAVTPPPAPTPSQPPLPSAGQVKPAPVAPPLAAAPALGKKPTAGFSLATLRQALKLSGARPAAPPPPPAAPGLASVLTEVPTPPAPHLPHLTLSPTKSLWDWLKDWFTPRPRPATPPKTVPYIPPSMPSVTGKRMEIPAPTPKPAVKAEPPKETAQTQAQIDQLQQQLATLQKEMGTKTATEAQLAELQKQLTQVTAEREKLQSTLVNLQQKLAAAPPPPTVKTTVVTTPPLPPEATVKVITQETAVKAGLPRLTSTPNVVTGIAKDTDGNLLPGVLVTVRDREGVPLRALKTNKLGQFAASTPLPNGVYNVEIEDPRGRFTFNRVQITLNGAVMPALEIIAKSQKQVIREQLAQEIFGKPTI